jgi:hypothetical protein
LKRLRSADPQHWLTKNYCRFDPDAEEEPADNPDDEQITDETGAAVSQQSQQSLSSAPKASVAANLKSAFSQSKPFSFSFLGGAKEEEEEKERRREEDSKQSALFR